MKAYCSYANDVLEERCSIPPSSDETKRVVRLTLREIRRGELCLKDESEAYTRPDISQMKELSILELYILSCIDRGCNTPYRMQQEGGLSLGATSPILPRLAKLELVRRSTERTSTNRPRHEYSLTKEGKQQAQLGWEIHLRASAPPADTDALLRVVDMAMYYGGAVQEIADLVKRAAQTRANLAERSTLQAAELSSVPASYLATKTVLDAGRYLAEAGGLNDLAASICRSGALKKAKRRR